MQAIEVNQYYRKLNHCLKLVTESTNKIEISLNISSKLLKRSPKLVKKKH